MIDRTLLIKAMGYTAAKLDPTLCVTHLNVALPTYNGYTVARRHVTIMPTTTGRKHRIFVHCKCGTLVPFGRANQHKCKPA